MENNEPRIAANAELVERRAFTRRVVSGLALVPVDIGPDCGFGLLVDLSEGGASIQGVIPLDKSETKTLTWTFPGQDTSIEVRGRVTWSDNNLFGIAFTELSDHDRARIRSWVEDHTRDSLSEPNPDIPAKEQLTAPSTPDSDTPHPAGHADGDSMWRIFQLGLLADHLRSALSADGVAIAVASGSSFVCQASAGRAPDLGAIAGSGLSAECIRTGTVIYCANAQNDARVDVQARDSLKLGSAIVFPVRSAGGNLVALLEAFWIRTNTFADSDLTSLSNFADSVLTILDPDHQSALGNALPSLLDRREPTISVEKDATCAPQWPQVSAWHIPDQPAQAGSGVSIFARLLVFATGFLGVLAVLTGVSLWYFTRAKGKLAHDNTATQFAIATTPDKTAVALPEIEPSTPDDAANASTKPRLGNARDLVVSAIEFTPAGTSPQVTADSAAARSKGIRVVLDVQTDEEGKMTDLRVVSGDPELAQLAKSALADKRYPQARGNQSVSRRGQVVVSFAPRP